MKPVKILAGIVVVVVVIAAVGVFVLFSKLDSVVAEAIERAGSHVTGTEVTVAGVEIHIKEGRGSITGLTVSNPDGFSDNEAFYLGELTLDVVLNSMRSEEVVIDLIRVASPRVLLELDEKGNSNLDAIRKYAESVMGGASGGGSGEGEGAGSEGDEGPPIIIRSIQFETGQIKGDASAVGVDPFEVTLPAFTLINLGAPGGLPASEIGKAIVFELTQKAAEAVARDKAGDMLEKELKDALGEDAKGLLDKIK